MQCLMREDLKMAVPSAVCRSATAVGEPNARHCGTCGELLELLRGSTSVVVDDRLNNEDDRTWDNQVG